MIFTSFVLADVEKHDAGINEFLDQWRQSDVGQWASEHCPNISYNVFSDPEYWGHKLVIYGELSEEEETYFTLKFK
jgi:hypothetical protein